MEWGRQTDSLYVWDYTTDFRYFAIPFPNAYALQNNIRFCPRCGAALPLHHRGRLCGACYQKIRRWTGYGHGPKVRG